MRLFGRGDCSPYARMQGEHWYAGCLCGWQGPWFKIGRNYAKAQDRAESAARRHAARRGA